MAESSALNSDSKVERSEEYAAAVCGIKEELEVMVKPEPAECAVCAARRAPGSPLGEARTASGASLLHFLCRFTRHDLAAAPLGARLVCKPCLDLINVLEQAEIEYFKVKEAFEAIINKNPLFDCSPQPISLSNVKAEICPNGEQGNEDIDSEDEPLAHTKKKKPRKEIKRKKKPSSTITKRKARGRPPVHSDSFDRWECEECGVTGEGGAVAEAAHKLAAHTLNAHAINEDCDLKDIKTEDSADGSQSSFFDNNSPMEPCLKIEYDMSDDHSSTEASESVSSAKSRKKKSTVSVKKSKMKPQRKTVKVMHQCDQCDAKYSSWIRLERHKLSHDGSKPPYICEVCGAHYKHKRACDIHIALHKGISNWKCDECNKLFPSKSALQRHNNIHTGKLNYQCDLCGKSFIHTSSFKMHKLSHSGVKPHSCDVCGLALMTRSHLKRHKRVHSGEKRHECPICGKRFSERYNLAAHSRSHEAPVAVASPPRRLFRCPYCPERYERRYMLERHTATAHGCTLERPLPTPRNTMSKLLKAQAQRRSAPETEAKEERGTDSRSPPPPPPKIANHLAAAPAAGAGSWSGAYAAEFGLRPDYSH